jgi:thiol-disulfide isomerase/thioredoxin
MPSMHRRRVPAIALLVLAFGAAACSRGPGSADGGSSSPGGTIRAENATTAPLLPVEADALPDFTVARYRDLLTQLRGTPVVVTMWGSWCPPCKADAPMLARAHDAYGDRVQFLGIDIEDSVESARTFMRTYDWTFPSIRDPVFPSSFRTGLGFVAQPNTLFYDASGRLASTWQGPLTDASLRDGLHAILSSEEPAG